MWVIRHLILVLSASLFGVGSVLAQGTEVPFGGLEHDSTLPVEVTADQLAIDQGDGSATFIGNVIVGQGEMRLSAAKIRVEYLSEEGERTGKVSKMVATGGVTMVNGTETAESDEAIYDVEAGTVLMTGNVILTQGENALSSSQMLVNLDAGTAQLQGGVRSILQPGDNQ